ncbi:acyl-CoA dehydrogenase family protein [Bordetella genomosp. 13]|uniref:acyl-CoA dehydrogenase family protein n=1 Tax=Bordetella genomosp. 13 TaxID=463040 RepID=UPI0011A0E49F|nr:acyl-CoA dehydrogenase family protein [Bordetella genomosp. 13]
MSAVLNPEFLSLPSSGHREPAEDAAFREELQAFARAHCPPEIRSVVAAGDKITRPVYSRWQQILNTRGWAAPNWPPEHGGTGWDLRRRMIFEEVMADLDCPPLYHHGLGHIGPVIMQFGTEQQKAKFLPRILDTTDWWCQGYSEPGSGSDLASLSTPAVRDGDHYVINGQKIWTSHAHEADRIYLLARTSREGRKQEGISLFLIDMDTPGIRVRPIPTIDGWHHVNEVFLDDVRVPADRLVGEEGRGWTCAKYLLERERLPPASVAQLMRQWRRVARLLHERRQAEPLRDYGALDDELLALAARIKGAREMLAQAIDAMMRKEPLDAKPSALKQACSVVSQSLTRIAYLAVGEGGTQRLLREDDAASPDGTWVQNYLFARSKTIAGGTTEVQLNVVARSLFGS